MQFWRFSTLCFLTCLITWTLAHFDCCMYAQWEASHSAMTLTVDGVSSGGTYAYGRVYVDGHNGTSSFVDQLFTTGFSGGTIFGPIDARMVIMEEGTSNTTMFNIMDGQCQFTTIPLSISSPDCVGSEYGYHVVSDVMLGGSMEVVVAEKNVTDPDHITTVLFETSFDKESCTKVGNQITLLNGTTPAPVAFIQQGFVNVSQVGDNNFPEGVFAIPSDCRYVESMDQVQTIMHPLFSAFFPRRSRTN